MGWLIIPALVGSAIQLYQLFADKVQYKLISIKLVLPFYQLMLCLCHYGQHYLWKNGKIENLNLNIYGTCINSNNKNLKE